MNGRLVSAQKSGAGGRTSAWLITAFGETKSLRQWSDDPRCSVEPPTLLARIRADWDAEKAIATPSRGSRPERVAESVRLYGEGASVQQIAERMGVSRSSVAAWLSDAGVRVRRPRRRAPASQSLHPLVGLLRERRVKRGIRSEDLSRSLGWSVSTLTGYEAGLAAPRLDRASAWALELGMRLELVDVRPNRRGGLMPRQRQVLLCLARGLGAEGIGQELGISKETAREYVKTLYERLGVHNAGEAVGYGVAHGHITVSELREQCQ